MANNTSPAPDAIPTGAIPPAMPLLKTPGRRKTSAADMSRLTGIGNRAQARVRYRMMRAFLPTFATEVLRGPPEAPYNGKFLLGPHHLEWGKAVNRHSRILALAARDHGKSFFFIYAYALWMVAVRAPGREGYIISATDQQAKDHLRKIRDEVMGDGNRPGNPKLKHLLPLRKDNEKELIFANGSRIVARGFGSKVRGGHPFWVVGDDMLNDEHVWSETVRTKAVDYFLSAVEPMPVPGGQLVVVGTPFHAEDLYKQLERNGVYHVLKHPALDAVTQKPLWPARYDEAALAIKKKIMGNALRWSREYLCQPISDDSSIFPSALFEKPGIKRAYRLGLDGKHWQAQGFTCYMGVDLALSASAQADFFVCYVVAVCPVTQDLWIVDIQRRKGLGYQVQVDTIVSLAKAYDCQFVFVEANQYQRVISDMVIRESAVNVKAFYTTGRGGSKQVTSQRRGIAGTYSANKNALDRGVPGLRMLFENNKIRIPWEEGDPQRDLVQTWITEMQQYSFVEGKLQGVGAHDDTVMALWMAERAAKMGGGFAVHFGPEDESVEGEQDGKIPTPHGWVQPGEAMGDGDVPMPSIVAHAGPPPEDDDDDPAPDWFGHGAGGAMPNVPGLGMTKGSGW